MLANNQWEPFHIFGANGQQYAGIRPSLIPKPFKSAVVVMNGTSFKPGLPKGYSVDQVFGYDATMRVGLNMNKEGKELSRDQAYRLITLLKDGRRWSKLIYMNGHSEEFWMK